MGSYTEPISAQTMGTYPGSCLSITALLILSALSFTCFSARQFRVPEIKGQGHFTILKYGKDLDLNSFTLFTSYLDLDAEFLKCFSLWKWPILNGVKVVSPRVTVD